MVENVYVAISNYEALQRTLDAYGKEGFSLVSTQAIPNNYGSPSMYLFFVRHTEENCKPLGWLQQPAEDEP